MSVCLFVYSFVYSFVCLFVCLLAFLVCVCVCVCTPTRFHHRLHCCMVVARSGGVLRSLMRAYWKVHKVTATDKSTNDEHSKTFNQALRPFLHSGLSHFIRATNCDNVFTPLIMLRCISQSKYRSRCMHSKVG